MRLLALQVEESRVNLVETAAGSRHVACSENKTPFEAFFEYYTQTSQTKPDRNQQTAFHAVVGGGGGGGGGGDRSGFDAESVAVDVSAD